MQLVSVSTSNVCVHKDGGCDYTNTQTQTPPPHTHTTGLLVKEGNGAPLVLSPSGLNMGSDLISSLNTASAKYTTQVLNTITEKK